MSPSSGRSLGSHNDTAYPESDTDDEIEVNYLLNKISLILTMMRISLRVNAQAFS